MSISPPKIKWRRASFAFHRNQGGRTGRSLLANARGTRIKLLVHDGFGVGCAARRLNAGHFTWASVAAGGPASLELGRAQFDALVLGLPLQLLPELHRICRA
ncbi:IS66 family insertion sequence element accessory protein TnpB [uncultured Pseudacidovorax sp.]|uniref:IS66 family insertion sequence element accessory protein TnpB n=1 Tax=uncultured Pseudacidovorax sp. TaxID=679313 RepID=UPI00344B430A